MKRDISIVLLLLSLLILNVGIVKADLPPDWIRMDEEGQFPESGQASLGLFSYGSDLYVQNIEWSDITGLNEPFGDLYKFKSSPCLKWEKQTITQADLSPFKSADLSQFPSGTIVKPMVMFNGQLYAVVYQTGATTFEIWRSPDLGKEKMTWDKVVSDGFGKPLNHNLGFLIEYNKKLIAVTTNTRIDPSASFGDESQYGPGIEVWESPTGDYGSWNQINVDGFGTESTYFDSELNKDVTYRTNQDFGAGAVYKDHLFIGTLSHSGGQVWQYDGTGLNGWKDITPKSVGGGPVRYNSMVIYENYLYMSEGYPTGDIDKYDGSNWEIAVKGSGPWNGPFSNTNAGIAKLAVAGGKLYASTIGEPFNPGAYHFAQVWGYPFLYKPATCEALTGATISLSPKSDTNELGSFNIHTVIAKVEANGAGVSGVNINFNIISGPNAKPENVGSGPTNSTGQAPFNYSAKQGPSGLGTDVIEACFINEKGEKVCTQATKKWVDTTPPVVNCLGTSVDKKTGTYELTAKDAVDPNPKIFVIDTGSGTEFGPFASGTIIQYTENTGKPKSKKNEKDVEIKGNGQPAVRAVDASGNEAKASCSI